MANQTVQPFFVMTALVIPDKASRKKIAHEIGRALIEFKKAHQHKNKSFCKELKGHSLRRHPKIRMRLFRRMTKKVNFAVYVLIIDKRRVKQQLPTDYMRRYAVFALNLLVTLPISQTQRWVTLVVDSQARARTSRVSRSKADRLRQSRLRQLDWIRHQQFRNIVVHGFKKYLSKKGVHLAVWLRHSNQDYCLQAADILSHFFFEEVLQGDVINSLEIPGAGKISKQTKRKEAKERLTQQNHANFRSLISSRVRSIFRPKRLMRKDIVRALGLQKKRSRKGNRGA